MTPDGLSWLEHRAREGRTDEWIAKEIGIATGTLYDWKKKYPEISKALKKTKDHYDDEVEDVLYKYGTGQFKTQTTVTKWHIDPITGETIIEEGTTTQTQQPPNPTALIFWLKNRRPDQWRDQPNRDKDKTGAGGPAITIIADFPREKGGKDG